MKRAFTLIELLVVIAIIAILAAILFPVFAQAKDSAKNTQLLSNTKQMGTSNIMYATDYDDMIAPTMASQPVIAGDYGWQDLVQPYMKNYELVINPKRVRISPTEADYEWKRLQYFGMPARAATNAGATAGYFTGTNLGRVVRYDGVGGLVNLDPVNADWLGRLIAPSLTTSAVADVSNTALIVESTNWDMWWSFSSSNPLGGCHRWNGGSIIPSTNWGYNGPTTSTRPSDSLRTGYGAGCYVPNGRTTYVAVDSSAKSVDMRGYFYAGSTLSSAGGYYTIKGFNPQGW